jgi:predicted permease
VSFPVDAQLWLPLAQDPMATNQAYAYAGVGRLKAGVTLEEAQQDLIQAHRPIWTERDTAHVVSPLVMPLRERLVADFRNIGGALGVGVVLVLLIACANVASIMLARAIYRQREIGVRVALGASLGRVARQMITESLTLSLVAGGVGLLVGQAGLSLLLRTVPDRFPDWARFTPDGRTILFSALVVVLSALFFGVAPLLQIRQQDGRGALVGSSGRASISLAQRRTLNGLVVAEVALATVLLVGCGLLLRAYARVRDTDPGFRVDRVLSFRVALPPLRYPGGSERRRFFEEAIDRLKTVPGVRNVGAISCPPFTCHNGYFFEAEGEETASRGLPSVDPVVLLVSASPGYFDVMGIRLLQGRVFTESDGRQGGLRAVVVNETFVKQKWPGVANPVGRRIRARGGDSTTWLTVVGVTGDVKHYGLDTPMLPSVYLPLALESDINWASYAFQLQTVGSPTAVLPDARRIIQSLDAELPLFQVSSMADALEHSLALRRAFAWLLAVFAGIALVLAVGGIYAVLSYLVGRRIREIGIRMTLGAQRRQVLSLVVRQGVVLVVLGLGFGLPLALFGGRLLGSQLVGVSWSDPVILVAVAGGLMVVGAVAALIPARRASAIDPRQALGAE